MIDLVVAIGCMVGTLLAQPFGDIQNGASVLTSIWAAGTGAGAASGETDLRAALSVLGSARVEVVVPAESVPLPAHAVAELAAAVTEELTNVAKHAGDGARAWVAVEDVGGEATVRTAPGEGTEWEMRVSRS